MVVGRRSEVAGQVRPLQTIVGAVDVTRLAYRRRGERNLGLADAALNLPRELHSYGLRELSAIEQLAARAAADFEAVYTQPTRTQAAVTEGDLLVLPLTAKGS